MERRKTPASHWRLSGVAAELEHPLQTAPVRHSSARVVRQVKRMNYQWSGAVCFAVLSGATLIVGTASAQSSSMAVVPHSLSEAVPDAHGIRRMATLRGLNKVTGRAIDIPAPVGVPVTLGSLSITVRFCHTVPPEEPPETTAFLQIDEKPLKAAAPTRIFSGWMFASTPALNGLQHPTYDVWVITCKTDEPPPAAPEAEGAAPVAPADAAAPAPPPKR